MFDCVCALIRYALIDRRLLIGDFCHLWRLFIVRMLSARQTSGVICVGGHLDQVKRNFLCFTRVYFVHVACPLNSRRGFAYDLMAPLVNVQASCAHALFLCHDPLPTSCDWPTRAGEKSRTGWSLVSLLIGPSVQKLLAPPPLLLVALLRLRLRNQSQRNCLRTATSRPTTGNSSLAGQHNALLTVWPFRPN